MWFGGGQEKARRELAEILSEIFGFGTDRVGKAGSSYQQVVHNAGAFGQVQIWLPNLCKFARLTESCLCRARDEGEKSLFLGWKWG